jgi:biotin operon repressor
MIDRAPYNRETIALIRKGATAQSLRWDDSFYQRVCKDHGIELYRPTALPIDTSPVAAQPVPKCDCEYRSATQELIRGDQAVILTRTIGNLFCIIAKAPAGCFIGGPRIATQMGVLPDAVSSKTSMLRNLVRPLGIDINSERHSGYRLLNANTGEPLRVSIVGSAK